MSNDNEKLKQEEADKSARLQELMYVKPFKNSKLTNNMINNQLASPKKSNQAKKHFPETNYKMSTKLNDEKTIEHICDYYDELQYNYENFNNKSQNMFDDITKDDVDDNKSNNSFNSNLKQYYQLTKLRKDILNRKLIDHREKVRSNKFKQCSDKSLILSLSSIVDSLTIPTFHFHLILSLTMVLLTHQCPHYLLVL